MSAVKLKEDQMFIGNNIECVANLGGGRKCKETEPSSTLRLIIERNSQTEDSSKW